MIDLNTTMIDLNTTTDDDNFVFNTTRLDDEEAKFYPVYITVALIFMLVVAVVGVIFFRFRRRLFKFGTEANKGSRTTGRQCRKDDPYSTKTGSHTAAGKHDPYSAKTGSRKAGEKYRKDGPYSTKTGSCTTGTRDEKKDDICSTRTGSPTSGKRDDICSTKTGLRTAKKQCKKVTLTSPKQEKKRKKFPHITKTGLRK